MLCLGLALVSTVSAASNIDFYKGPEPLAVLLQSDPWLMVVGSDMPMVVVYADGQVVYLQRDDKKGASYFHKQLTPAELAETKQKIAAFGDYSKINGHYDLAPNVTDMPSARMYLNLDGSKVITSVYGLTVANTKLPGVTAFPGQQKPDSLPDAIRKLHGYLATLRYEDGKPWRPDYLEVMVWGYDYAPDKSIHWPKDWPGLESPSTVRHGDLYSIFLPAKELARLEAFLATRKEKGAVEIGGKKWAVSYRYVFPSEPVWQRAFRDNDRARR